MEPLPACLPRLAGPELRDVAEAVLAVAEGLSAPATTAWLRAFLLGDGPYQRQVGPAWVDACRRLLVMRALAVPSPVRALVAGGRVGGRAYAQTTELALAAHAGRTAALWRQWVSSLPREPHADALVRAWSAAW